MEFVVGGCRGINELMFNIVYIGLGFEISNLPLCIWADSWVMAPNQFLLYFIILYFLFNKKRNYVLVAVNLLF